MKPLYLKLTDDQIIYSNNVNTLGKAFYELNPKLNFQENLQTFKNQLDASCDVIIITNPNKYILKKNIFLFNKVIIDFGTELENIFHTPVINFDDIMSSGLKAAFKKELNYTTWHLDYYGLDHSKRQYGQESMQTVGNGFLGLRGSYFESKANDDNYPATYAAGVFNQLSTPINGRNVINEDLVNLPNAQYLTFSIDDGPKFKINDKDIQESLRSLNMKDGCLTITLLIKLADGKELKIVEKRIVDLNNYHDYYLQYSIKPLNFSAKMTFYTEIDGSVVNSNVERYRNLANKHLEIDKIQNNTDDAILLAHTNQSKINIAVKSHLNYPDSGIYSTDNTSEIANQKVEFNASEGTTYTFEKNVAIFTSLETKNDLELTINDHTFLANFQEAFAFNSQAWKKVWQQEDVVVAGDVTAQKLLRLNSYSMTTAAQINANKDLDISVGSRGLTGEGYRDHIFWDELFDMNFYVLHDPELVKSLLMYRYNRLRAAMDYAADDDYQGAMYPWQSGLYGDEQSQELHLNPITNKWDPDNSRKQRHVSLAVAYNVWNYYNSSQDEKFMAKYGLEMLLEIAKFWIDKSQYDETSGKYTIADVMGPDEFHEGYPGKDDDGLKNNAYTNIMVSWLFKELHQLLENELSDTVSENLHRTNFTNEDIKKLNEIRQSLKLDFKADILGQFEGYFDLKEIDLEKYRQQYGNISRMDRILKAHNDTPDNYQVAKQADTLMALFNLRETDFLQIMNDLNYPIGNPNKFITDNIKYYLARTSHGSTLSRIVYSMLLLKIHDDSAAWKLFYEALTSDYYDIQGGTTAEGIHLGVMGATLNVVTSYFGGVDYRGDMLEISPQLPKQWNEIDFKMIFKKINFTFQITQETIMINADQDTEIMFLGKKLPLTANQTIELTF